jgi:hypothetical protein
MKLLFNIFVIAHGLVHLAIWLAPTPNNPIFDARYSWLFNRLGLTRDFMGKFAAGLALITALAFILGAIFLFFNLGFSKILLILGALLSLVLLTLYLSPWFTVAFLINLGILYLLMIRHWPIK